MADRSPAHAASLTLERLYDAYNRHDLNEVAELYSSAGSHEDVAMDRIAHGAEAITEGLGQFYEALPDARWDAEHISGRGNRACAAYVLTGTLLGRLGPFAPDGQRIRLPGVHVLETDPDGQIIRSTDYWDLDAFVGQLNAPIGPVERSETPIVGPRQSRASADEFRGAMRLLAGGVALVTTIVDGRPWGLTVSACCSLTADPPQVLVSLDSRTASCRAIVQDGSFGVDVLGSDQIGIAQQCSAHGRPKFIEEAVAAGFGQSRSPVIAGALIHLDCELVDSHRVGDHMLLFGLVGAVVRPRGPGELAPLVYFERAFRSVGAALA